MSCFNRKSLMAIGAALALVLLLQPSAFGAAAPLLMAAACPMGMLIMMRGATCRQPPRAARPASTDAELAGLRAEVAQLRADAGSYAGEAADRAGAG